MTRSEPNLTSSHVLSRLAAVLAFVMIAGLAAGPAWAQATPNPDDDSTDQPGRRPGGAFRRNKPGSPANKPVRRPRTTESGAPVAPEVVPAPAPPPPPTAVANPPPISVVGGPNGTAGSPAVNDKASIEGAENAELYKCMHYPEGAHIRVTLKPDTDLKDLVAWVMGFTCKSFIYGNAISGRAAKVTIIAPSMMTPSDAYKLFLVALQSMNLTIVPKGNTFEIVEAQRGRELPVPVYKNAADVPVTDQIVRVVLRPAHVSPDEIAQVLTAMKTATGVVTPIPNAGVVIITDYGSNIDRMMDVVKEVDEPTAAEKIFIINLKSADAQEMATKLQEIFGISRTGAASTPQAPRPQPQPGQPPGAAPAAGSVGSARPGDNGSSATPSKIIPDQRTNSLIVIASERAYARILALVRRLDPLDVNVGETGSIHVYYLNNADAETLAGTINSLVVGQGTVRQAARPAGQPGAAPGAAPAPGQPLNTQAFEGQIKVTHDKPTNSLVIVSSAKDFLALREVIKKLDLPRRQVFVEATIIELSTDKTRTVGFSYHAGQTFSLQNADDSVYFGGVESKSLSSLATSPATLDGLIGGVIGAPIPGISIPSIGVLFQLVQNTNDVNVLSSPNILTTDNEPAEISVGQNIPYQSTTLGAGALSALTSSSTASTAAVNPLATLGLGGLGQSIQRQDLALTLKITPHVNDSDFVRLEIEQDIKDIVSVDFGGNGPSWSNRKVKTVIVVKDQQPVVIGGLMADKMTLTETKVPLLGDIPLLGYLFKYSSRERQKTNLIIFLTPYIIKDQSDIQRIFEQKVREKKEFIDAYTAFEGRDWEPNLDYRRKRGLIAEINRAVAQSDDDERMLKEIEKQKVRKRAEEGPVDLPPDLQNNNPPTEPEEMGTPIAPPPAPAPAPQPQPGE